MNRNATAAHIVICVVVGGLVAAITPAKWLAASLWVSAAMFINGSLAMVEDAPPGGFENPDGSQTPEFAKGIGATKFALQSSRFAALAACRAAPTLGGALDFAAI